MSSAEIGRFAQRWATALKGAVSPTMTRAEIQAMLARLTGRLVDAMRAPEADVEPIGREVGARLIAANHRDAAVLNRTLRLLGTDFVTDLGKTLGLTVSGPTVSDPTVPDPAVLHRLALLKGVVAEGFTTAMRGQVLDEQEEIQRAAIAAAQAAEERRRASEARFAAVFSEATVGIGMVGLDGLVTDVNGAMADMLGVSPADIRGRGIVEVIGSDNMGSAGGGSQRAGNAYASYLDLLTGTINRFRIETPHTRPDGQITYIDLSMTVVRDSAGEPEFLIGVAVDLTERRRLQDRLWHEARHDALTELPNRTLFLERLALAAQPFMLCYLDLDGFKNINDSLGHEAGDRLLITVAHRLRTALAADGRLVARLGGDEFVILVEKCGAQDLVCQVAEQILAAVAEPIRLGGNELTVTGSVGVVHSAITGTDPGHVMRAADITLYQAKANGKGRWEQYDPAHGATEMTRRSLATALPSSLARREFYLDYQPLVRLADTAVLGFEALARWRHPRWGLVPPVQFIPIAEETGHIVVLGRWVVVAACQQARQWFDEFPGRHLYVSVNVAATQLRQPTFVSDVLGALDEAGLPPDRLQLELTESAVAGDTRGALTALRELAAAGVRLAIDDFGTGYSNLAHLGRLPVHQLKIDRSFLKQSPSGSQADPAHEKIVAATISLAHSLDLEVVAEGVETTSQADRLRLQSCDCAQGWLFGAPAAPSSAAALVTRHVDQPNSA